jgi:hypothetical protein
VRSLSLDAVQAALCLRACSITYKFLPVLPLMRYRTVVKVDARELHTVLLNVCEFRENRRRECRTLLMGVSEVT